MAMPDGPIAAAQSRWLVLALVLAVFLVDGMDTQMMAVAVPTLAGQWQMRASAFALAIALGHAGGAAGGALGGVLGDRIGTRNAVILCAVLFGVVSLGITLVHDLRLLEILRLICGLGLGGAIAPALALLTEYFPARQRSLAISLAFLCSPFGISVAGLLAAYVMPAHGWRSLFFIAGVTPLVLAGLMRLLLSAAPRGDAGAPHGRSVAGRLADWWRSLRRWDGPGAPVAWGGPAGLFAGFVCTYGAMSLVLSWLPSLMTGRGLPLHDAGLAISVWSAAGMVGVPTSGWAAGRWGARRVTTIVALTGVAATGTIALTGLLGSGAPHAGAAFFVPLAIAGAMTNSMIILLYALAAELFPPTVRSTGMGLVATAGRSGSIATAYLGGRLSEWVSLSAFFAIAAALLLSTCLAVNLRRPSKVPVHAA